GRPNKRSLSGCPRRGRQASTCRRRQKEKLRKKPVAARRALMPRGKKDIPTRPRRPGRGRLSERFGARAIRRRRPKRWLAKLLKRLDNARPRNGAPVPAKASASAAPPNAVLALAKRRGLGRDLENGSLIIYRLAFARIRR